MYGLRNTSTIVDTDIAWQRLLLTENPFFVASLLPYNMDEVLFNQTYFIRLEFSMNPFNKLQHQKIFLQFYQIKAMRCPI